MISVYQAGQGNKQLKLHLSVQLHANNLYLDPCQASNGCATALLIQAHSLLLDKILRTLR